MATIQKYTKRGQKFRRVKYFFYTIDSVKIGKQKSFKSLADAKRFERRAEVLEYRTKQAKQDLEDVREWSREGLITHDQISLLIKPENLVTLDDAIDNYVKTLEIGRPETKLIPFRTDNIRTYFDPSRLLSAFTEDDGDDFRAWLRNERGYATSYINKHLRTLKNVFKKQYKKGVIRINPFFDLKPASKTDKESRGKGYCFSMEETKNCLTQAALRDCGKPPKITRLNPADPPTVDTRAKHVVTHDGITLSLRQWADVTGVSYQTLYKRLMDGMAPEKLLQPVAALAKRPLFGGNLHWLLLLGFGTGGRRKELQLAQFKHIDFERRLLLFPHRVKGGEERIVGLGSKLYNEANRRFNACGRDPEMYLLPKCDESTITDVCGQHFRNCGVSATCHDMRHTYVTNVQKYGELSKYEAMQRSGHKDEKTLNIYTHLDLELGEIVEDRFEFLQEE